jgi:hypothetical protein
LVPGKTVKQSAVASVGGKPGLSASLNAQLDAEAPGWGKASVVRWLHFRHRTAEQDSDNASHLLGKRKTP